MCEGLTSFGNVSDACFLNKASSMYPGIPLVIFPQARLVSTFGKMRLQ